MGRNKQATCNICLRFMRSDTIKRHMKVHAQPKIQHKNKQVEDDDEMRNDDQHTKRREVKLMEDTMEVWKIYKLLQRMKNKMMCICT